MQLTYATRRLPRVFWMVRLDDRPEAGLDLGKEPLAARGSRGHANRLVLGSKKIDAVSAPRGVGLLRRRGPGHHKAALVVAGEVSQECVSSLNPIPLDQVAGPEALGTGAALSIARDRRNRRLLARRPLRRVQEASLCVIHYGFAQVQAAE
jgi:hypothetical protein